MVAARFILVLLLLAPLAAAFPAPALEAPEASTDAARDGDDVRPLQSVLKLPAVAPVHGQGSVQGIWWDPAQLAAAIETGGPLAGYRLLAREQAKAASEDGFTHRGLHPIGDADGDGRDDVLVSSQTVVDGQTDSVTYTLLSAGREERIIYTFDVDFEQESLWQAGDFDADGVTDFVRVEESSDSGTQFTMDVAFVSGRDLSILATEELTGGYTFEQQGSPILVGSQTQQVTYELPYPVDLMAAPGYSILTVHMVQEDEYQGVLVPISGSTTLTTGTSLRQFSLDGRALWTAGGPESLWTGLVDGQGDGVADLVFVEGLSQYTYRYDPLGVPVFGSEDDAARDVTIHMVAGDSGVTIWSTAAKVEAADAAVVTLGALYGQGPVLALVEWDMQMQQSLPGFYSGMTVDTRMRTFSAVDGAQEADHLMEGRFVLPMHLGDADTDGRDDMLLFVAELQTASVRFVAAGAGMNELWSTGADGIDAIADMDGDRVLDLIVADDDLFVRTGTTGKKIWSLDTEPPEGGLQSLAILFDLDLDGGHDIARFTMDTDGRADNGTLTLLNGGQGTLIWSKRIYHAEDFENATADAVHLSTVYLGDLDRDGAPDLGIQLLALEQCDNCDEPSILSAMAMKARDGATILRYDNSPPVDGAPSEFKALLGPAGRALESRLGNDTSALGLLPLLGLLGVLTLRRRP